MNTLDLLPDDSRVLLEAKLDRRLFNKAFHLSLSDGTNWCLRSDHHNFQLVSKLATIMELDECAIKDSHDDFHELIFFRNDNADMVLEGRVDEIPSKLYSYGSSDSFYFYHLRTLRIWHHNSISDAAREVLFNSCAINVVINMWFAFHPIYQRSICKGGLPFHAGLAELDGRGVLLAAASNTGKSTCCHRLPDHWQPLCDDEMLVTLDKQKKYRAHPFPTWSEYLWKQSEKTWNVQYSVPLSTVFFLEQSKIDKVAPIGEGEAALLMSESAMQICEKFWRNASIEEQREFRRKLFNNACKMAKQIPAYRLGVSRNGRFWEKMEGVL